ncbi:hypothetical protein AYO49_05010 [Verrucomicrobiaceae bacterium SCGC AG-212-N21]|nr:hypothetical protein AYO49_05010 [Verrucomicrobiaceae bacterium SCGC AG-212-N21]
MDEDDIILQLWLQPSFEPLMSWTIYSSDNGSFHLRRIRWDFITDVRSSLGEPSIFGSDASCPSTVIEPRMKALSALSLPMFNLRDTIGTDGTTYGLRRTTTGYFAEFSWWWVPPPGCEAIAEWYHDCVAALEDLLPAHTDHLLNHGVRP